MISDKYVLSSQTELGSLPENTPKLLDITEHMAASCGFEGKDLLQIRLITEEMIASVHSGIILAPGELWFSADKGLFAVTASVRTSGLGILPEQRKKILDAVGPAKKSKVFAVIQKFIDDMAAANDALTFSGYLGSYYGEFSGGHFAPLMDVWPMDDDTWSMAMLDHLVPVTASGKQSTKKDQEDSVEQDLEIRLLKGFADDIRVSDRRGTLEMSVIKKIPGEFISRYISRP